MKPRSVIAAIILGAICTMPTHSIAKNKSGHCPPGLAKKNPPCVPPGLAKKRYRVGDRLPDGDYYYVRDPSRYGLPYLNYNESYYRIGDSYIRVDRDTREVLELIEALGAVLN